MARLSPLRITIAAGAAVVAILGLSAAAGAFSDQSRMPAASSATAPSGQVMQPGQAGQPATAPQTFVGPGYLPTPEALAAIGIVNPLKVEREFNHIEVLHRDAQGRLVETYLDAHSGAVLKQEYNVRNDRRGRGRDDD